MLRPLLERLFRAISTNRTKSVTPKSTPDASRDETMLSANQSSMTEQSVCGNTKSYNGLGNSHRQLPWHQQVDNVRNVSDIRDVDKRQDLDSRTHLSSATTFNNGDRCSRIARTDREPPPQAPLEDFSNGNPRQQRRSRSRSKSTRSRSKSGRTRSKSRSKPSRSRSKSKPKQKEKTKRWLGRTGKKKESAKPAFSAAAASPASPSSLISSSPSNPLQKNKNYCDRIEMVAVKNEAIAKEGMVNQQETQNIFAANCDMNATKLLPVCGNLEQVGVESFVNILAHPNCGAKLGRRKKEKTMSVILNHIGTSLRESQSESTPEIVIPRSGKKAKDLERFDKIEQVDDNDIGIKASKSRSFSPKKHRSAWRRKRKGKEEKKKESDRTTNEANKEEQRQFGSNDNNKLQKKYTFVPSESLKYLFAINTDDEQNSDDDYSTSSSETDSEDGFLEKMVASWQNTSRIVPTFGVVGALGFGKNARNCSPDIRDLRIVDSEVLSSFDEVGDYIHSKPSQRYRNLEETRMIREL